MEAGVEPCQNIDSIKLSEDQGKRVVFDHNPADLLRTIAANNPQLIEQIMFAAAASARNVFTTVSERATATFADWATTTGGGSYASYGSAGGRMSVIAEAAKNAVAIVAGWVPHGVFEIPFGDQDDMDEWYDVTKLGGLKLNVLGASGLAGTETVQIFLQQLRKYATE
jgi:hypothetical protein